eukprot:jgi/Botrbrau1/14478/Bobra.0014s0114.1
MPGEVGSWRKLRRRFEGLQEELEGSHDGFLRRGAVGGGEVKGLASSFSHIGGRKRGSTRNWGRPVLHTVDEHPSAEHVTLGVQIRDQGGSRFGDRNSEESEGEAGLRRCWSLTPEKTRLKRQREPEEGLNLPPLLHGRRHQPPAVLPGQRQYKKHERCVRGVAAAPEMERYSCTCIALTGRYRKPRGPRAAHLHQGRGRGPGVLSGRILPGLPRLRQEGPHLRHEGGGWHRSRSSLGPNARALPPVLPSPAVQAVRPRLGPLAAGEETVQETPNRVSEGFYPFFFGGGGGEGALNSSYSLQSLQPEPGTSFFWLSSDPVVWGFGLWDSSGFFGSGAGFEGYLSRTNSCGLIAQWLG